MKREFYRVKMTMEYEYTTCAIDHDTAADRAAFMTSMRFPNLDNIEVTEVEQLTTTTLSEEMEQ